jgi:twitching motility protein PilT
VRLQFSQILEAVLCQTLLPKASGQGRIAAFEVMLANTAIRNHIREGKTHEINATMLLNRNIGMQTLDQSLASLVHQGLIKRSDAMLKTSHPDALTKLIDKPF